MYTLTDTADKSIIIAAIEKVVDRITSTMGPEGRYVIIDAVNEVLATKDGVSVARWQSYEDPFEALGSKMVIDACSRTEKVAGDGTTLTALLIAEFIKAGLEDADKHSPSRAVVRMKEFVDNINLKLTEISRPVVINGEIDFNLLSAVATTSADGRKDIALPIVEMIKKVGPYGMIKVQESNMDYIETEVRNGYSLDVGAVSEGFFNAPNRCEYENPLVVIINDRIELIETLQGVLEGWNRKYARHNEGLPPQRPLVIFCNAMYGDALATLVQNSKRGYPVCVIRTPHSGDLARQVLEDIRIVTQTDRVFDVLSGDRLKDFGEDYDEFGSCLKIEATKNSTAIYFDKEQITKKGILGELIEKRVKAIEALIEKEPNMEQIYRSRIARLTTGIGVIKAGAPTDMEKSNTKTAIDDTQLACFAACKYGVVPGGGMAIPLAAKDIFHGYQDLVRSAFNKIIENAETGAEADDLFNLCIANKGLTITFQEGQIQTIDSFDAGILDATLSIQSAITNAASVATQIIRTKYFQIVKVNEKARATQ